MKIWRSGLLGSLPIIWLAVLLAFSGCELSTDDDSSGVDAYLAAHPYTSASRDMPRPVVLTISPITATASIIGQTTIFTVSGGEGAYTWGVSDSANGKIVSRGADQAIYTCLVVGNNDVVVQDAAGHFASARITPVVDAMTINPASVSLSGGALYASFSVSGGTPPYSWTSGNPGMGTVSYSTGSSYVAAYMAVAGAYGQNEITVIDAEGRTTSATVTQEP